MRCIWLFVNPIHALFVYPRQFKELRKTRKIGLFNLNVFICNIAVKIVSLETIIQSLDIGTLVKNYGKKHFTTEGTEALRYTEKSEANG